MATNPYTLLPKPLNRFIRSFINGEIRGAKRTYNLMSSVFNTTAKASATALNSSGVVDGEAKMTLAPALVAGKMTRTLTVTAPEGKQANGYAYTVVPASMGLPAPASAEVGSLKITATVVDTNADGSVNIQVTGSGLNSVQMYVNGKLIQEKPFGPKLSFTVTQTGDNLVAFQGWTYPASVVCSFKIPVGVPIIPEITYGVIRGKFKTPAPIQAFEFVYEIQANGANATGSGQIRSTTFHGWDDKTTNWVDSGIDAPMRVNQDNEFEMHFSFDHANQVFYDEAVFVNGVAIMVDAHIPHEYTPAVMPGRPKKDGTGIYVGIQCDYKGQVSIADLEIDVYSRTN